LFSNQAPFLDSGTTYIYFTPDLFSNFAKYFGSFCARSKSNCSGIKSFQECYRWDVATYKTFEEFANTFPEISFQFNENEHIKWHGSDYLAMSLESEIHFCVGVKALKTNILGALFMKNYDVFFDRINKRVSFTRANCANLPNYVIPDESLPRGAPQSEDPTTPSQESRTIPQSEEPNVYLVSEKHGSLNAADNHRVKETSSPPFSFRPIVLLLLIAMIQEEDDEQ
jgi:hypothetical protein